MRSHNCAWAQFNKITYSFTTQYHLQLFNHTHHGYTCNTEPPQLCSPIIANSIIQECEWILFSFILTTTPFSLIRQSYKTSIYTSHMHQRVLYAILISFYFCPHITSKWHQMSVTWMKALPDHIQQSVGILDYRMPTCRTTLVYLRNLQ